MFQHVYCTSEMEFWFCFHVYLKENRDICTLHTYNSLKWEVIYFLILRKHSRIFFFFYNSTLSVSLDLFDLCISLLSPYLYLRENSVCVCVSILIRHAQKKVGIISFTCMHTLTELVLLLFCVLLCFHKTLCWYMKKIWKGRKQNMKTRKESSGDPSS